MTSIKRINNLIKAIDNNILTRRHLKTAVELIEESKDIPLPLSLSELNIKCYIAICAKEVSPMLQALKPHLFP